MEIKVKIEIKGCLPPEEEYCRDKMEKVVRLAEACKNPPVLITITFEMNVTKCNQHRAKASFVFMGANFAHEKTHHNLNTLTGIIVDRVWRTINEKKEKSARFERKIAIPPALGM
jgi:hypothetical protein